LNVVAYASYRCVVISRRSVDTYGIFFGFIAGICIIALCFCNDSSRSSASQIVFSAQRYVVISPTITVPVQPSGRDPSRFDKHASDDLWQWQYDLFPYHHLYLAEWPGGRPRRITFGLCDDIAPAFSPDGRKIAFFRLSNDGTFSAYVLTVRTGRLRKVFHFGPAYKPTLRWSPDGRWISMEDYVFSDPIYPPAWIVAADGGQTYEFHNMSCISWAPDSRYVFVAGLGNGAEIFDIKLSRAWDVDTKAFYGYWLNSTSLICTPLSIYPDTAVPVQLITGLGEKIGVIKLHFSDNDNSPDCYDDALSLRLIPHTRSSYLAESQHQATDGLHTYCYYIRSLKSPIRYLGEVDYPVPSPNGRSFASTTSYWEGSYKRGGARVGNLIVNTYSGTSPITMTHGYWDFDGIDWK
jgi:hypothetical protein